ncbi:MAG: regulator, partial [Actinomycetia bacterium]|nr:regulator [Actinomycetes bacterium]
MYRDLLENEARIAAHPAVTALAAGGRGGQVGDFGFDEIEDRDVDRLTPVDRTPLVLDADSSQRACIAAAVDGRSFVMDGPPGTGKSQTIANMIGALLHAGRTVLFVSEKVAALDVVRNRLADVGLDAFLLELHSSKATRKEVAAELGRSLNHRPVAGSGMSDVDREQLRRRQDELNRYATAMNEPRRPLGMSVHAVIGRLSELAAVRSAPRAGQPVVGLTPAVLGEIKRAAEDLARAWRPALEGPGYLWRGVRPAHSLTSRLQAAERALDSVTALIQDNESVAASFRLTGPSDAERLADLLERHSARPAGVPDRWVVEATEGEIAAAVDGLSGQIDVVLDRQQQVASETGTAWEHIPSPDGLAALDLRRIDGLDPAPLPVGRMTVYDIDDVLRRLREDATRLGTAHAALDDMAGLLRLPAPRTFDEADRLLGVAATATERDRPEGAWFFPRERERAYRAVEHLAGTAAALDTAEAAARRFYDDSALHVDAAGLNERFRTQHSGLRRLGGAYRQDKATVAACTRAGVAPADAHKHLPLIVEWQRAASAFEQAVPHYQQDLGSYFRGRETDRERVTRSIDRAAAIAELFPTDDLR